MGDEAKRTNPFLSYVEPNAIVAPEMYEKCALYGLLYTSIANDLVDQNNPDAMTLNKMISDQVKEYVRIMEKLLTGAPLTAKELEVEKNVRDYMKFYVPIDDPFNDDGSVNMATREANLAYIRDYRKNHDRVVGEMGKIIAYAKANGIQLEHGMLTRDQVELLLLAKREKCREFYDMVRANCDGKPGKIDKKDGSSKEGVHLRLYREGKNKVLKDKDKIRKESRKNALKIFGSVALWAAFGASIVFTAGALSPTLAGFVGSGMSATSLGQFFTGAIASIFSFRGGAKLTRMSVDGVKANYKRRKDLKEFMGPKINPEDLDALLANYGKESKDLTFNERKALLMFDKAAKMYFEKGKVEGEFDGEQLAKYLPQDLIDKYKYAEDARRFRLVTDKGGLYDRMFLKLPNEPTELVGDGNMGRSDVRSLYTKVIGNTNATMSDIRTAIEETEIALKNQKIPERIRNDYVMNLGIKLGGVAFSTFLDGVTSEGFADKVQQNITETPAFSTAIGMDTDTKANIENTYAYYQTMKMNTADGPLDSDEGLIREDIGVSLTAQLTYDKGSMVAASKAIPGVTLFPAHDAEVDAIAGLIVNLSSTDSSVYDDSGAYTEIDNVGAIQTRIKALEDDGADVKVVNYLKHMFGKKKRTVSNTVVGMTHRLLSTADASTTGPVVDIPNAISKFQIDDAGAIVGSEEHYKTVEEARQTIMSSGLSDTQKAEAVKMLEEKVQALEASKRAQVLQDSVRVIKEKKSSPNEMKAFQERIGHITFKSVEDFTVDGKTFDDILSEDVRGGTLRDYNRQLFQQAVEKAIKIEMKQNLYKVDINAGIKLLTKINSCRTNGYLSEGQSLALTSQLEVLLVSAVQEQIRQAKLNALYGNSLEDEYNKLVRLKSARIGDPQNPGLLEFFEAKTPLSVQIEQEIKKLGEAKGIMSQVRCTTPLSESDAREFARIYFFRKDASGNVIERDDSDPLRQIISNLASISSSHSASLYDLAESPNANPLTISDSDRYEDIAAVGYLQRMQKEIHRIKKLPNSEDKMAACMLAQIRIITMYKSYLNYAQVADIDGKRYADLEPAEKMERITRAGERLRPLFKAIDEISSEFGYDPIESILGDINTTNKATNYANSTQIQPQR